MTNWDSTYPYLRTHTLDPENQESPISFIEKQLTPEQYLYRRNHLHYPKIEQDLFELRIYGLVSRPMLFKWTDLFSMPSKTIDVVLECSGNQRSEFRPRVFGVQWDFGAVSQGRWTGVPLRYLLSMAGILPYAVEAVFTGADSGTRTDMEGIFNYERSMPLADILSTDDILIAYAYNDGEIPYRHGYPMRLIVPRWYGMASVKWLKQIRLVDRPFTGPFQAIDYNYYPHANSDDGKFPVTFIQTNSIIQRPTDLQILKEGVHSIQGLAWSGLDQLSTVEISFDDGSTWIETEFEHHPNSPYAWSRWQFDWKAQEGFYSIRVRARDSLGYQQPMKAYWNRMGYAYNALFRVRVSIER